MYTVFLQLVYSIRAKFCVLTFFRCHIWTSISSPVLLQLPTKHIFRDDRYPNLSCEVIRSQCINSSQPNMTHVTIKVDQPIKEGRIYKCEVVIEKRVNIVSGTYHYYYYEYVIKDTIEITTVYVTGARVIDCMHCSLYHAEFLFSFQWCHCQ